MNKWFKYLGITVGTMLLAYLIFMSLYFSTSEPSFCGLCHNIKPYYLSWEKSSHSSVKCLYCHEPRGFAGKLHSKSRGLNYVYQQWTGQYSIIAKAQIFEQNCIACHLGDYSSYPKTKRLDNNHYNLIKKDRSCLQCHRAVGHSINIFDQAKFK